MKNDSEKMTGMPERAPAPSVAAIERVIAIMGEETVKETVAAMVQATGCRPEDAMFTLVRDRLNCG